MVSPSSTLYPEILENMDLARAVYQAVDNGTSFIFINVNKTLETIENIKREKQHINNKGRKRKRY